MTVATTDEGLVEFDSKWIRIVQSVRRAAGPSRSNLPGAERSTTPLTRTGPASKIRSSLG